MVPGKYLQTFCFSFLVFVCVCVFFCCIFGKFKTKTDSVKNDCYMLFGLVNGFILMLIVNTGLRLLYIIIHAYIHACIWQHFIIYMSSRHYNFLSPMIRCCSSTLKWHKKGCTYVHVRVYDTLEGSRTRLSSEGVM